MRISIVFVVMALAAMLTGCQLTENIYLSEDGGGTMTFDIDASGVMALAGEQLAGTDKSDIDSVMTFKQLFDEKRDTIGKMTPAQQQQLKKFEDVRMRMQMSAVKKTLEVSLVKNFKSASELQDMMDAVKAMQSLDGKNALAGRDNPLGPMMEPGNTELRYTYDGKVFKRTLRVIDPVLQKAVRDTTGMMQMLLSGSQYIIKYHFPRKVKSVSNPDATLSADGKTVTIPFPLADYFEQPDKMSLEVVLDKK